MILYTIESQEKNKLDMEHDRSEADDHPEITQNSIPHTLNAFRSLCIDNGLFTDACNGSEDTCVY